MASSACVKTHFAWAFGGDGGCGCMTQMDGITGSEGTDPLRVFKNLPCPCTSRPARPPHCAPAARRTARVRSAWPFPPATSLLTAGCGTLQPRKVCLQPCKVCRAADLSGSQGFGVGIGEGSLEGVYIDYSSGMSDGGSTYSEQEREFQRLITIQTCTCTKSFTNHAVIYTSTIDTSNSSQWTMRWAATSPQG